MEKNRTVAMWEDNQVTGLQGLSATYRNTEISLSSEYIGLSDIVTEHIEDKYLLI